MCLKIQDMFLESFQAHDVGHSIFVSSGSLEGFFVTLISFCQSLPEGYSLHLFHG